MHEGGESPDIVFQMLATIILVELALLSIGLNLVPSDPAETAARCLKARNDLPGAFAPAVGARQPGPHTGGR